MIMSCHVAFRIPGFRVRISCVSGGFPYKGPTLRRFCIFVVVVDLRVRRHVLV